MNVHTMFRVSSYIIYVLADFCDTVPLRYSLDVYCIHNVKSRGQTDTFYLAKFRNVYNQKLKPEFKHSVLVDLKLIIFSKFGQSFGMLCLNF